MSVKEVKKGAGILKHPQLVKTPKKGGGPDESDESKPWEKHRKKLLVLQESFLGTAG